MKLLQAMGLAGAVLATGGAQAAAISDITITLDWSSLSITGPLTQPGTFTDPFTNETFSSDADAGVGIDNNEVAYDRAVDNAPVSASYAVPGMDLAAGYDYIADLPGYISYADAIINNDGAGVLNGWAWSFHGLIYQATGTGSVTIEVPYTVDAHLSTESVFEYANAGYSLFMDAVDADTWLATYNSSLAGDCAGDTNCAELSAEAAATLGPDSVYSFENWQWLESYGCAGPLPCGNSDMLSGVMSITFDVTDGVNYFFDAEGGVSAYTSTVPVPAAVWLFGSGLLGLTGFARRRKAV